MNETVVPCNIMCIPLFQREFRVDFDIYKKDKRTKILNTKPN